MIGQRELLAWLTAGAGVLAGAWRPALELFRSLSGHRQAAEKAKLDEGESVFRRAITMIDQYVAAEVRREARLVAVEAEAEECREDRGIFWTILSEHGLVPDALARRAALRGQRTPPS